MRRLALATSTAVFLTVVSSGGLLAQKTFASGTWKLNLEKSKITPGPGPKSATLTIAVLGDNVKTSFEEVEGDDSRVGYEYSATYDDGKDYPISGSGRPSWRDDLLVEQKLSTSGAPARTRTMPSSRSPAKWS
jgi:hypothetical protein